MDGKLNIKMSEKIDEVVGALAKVQGALKPAIFNRENPYLKNRYADFKSCMDACRGLLAENDLAISQMPSTSDGNLVLVTLLAHSSGQWIAGEFPLIATKMDSQGIGSAMTYAKRYSLCGMIGVVADEELDDDGEGAVGRSHKNVETREKSPDLLEDIRRRINAAPNVEKLNIIVDEIRGMSLAKNSRDQLATIYKNKKKELS